jgi:hypothetical protein
MLHMGYDPKSSVAKKKFLVVSFREFGAKKN